MNQAFNIDCMEAMKTMKDNEFDLARVDPPYGLGDFSQSDTIFIGTYSWNESVPSKEYFELLLRISKNQIIWGANYYNCFTSGGSIIWDKMNFHPQMSRCEIASCSLQKRVTFFQMSFQGMHRKRQENNHNTIHPCQKPIKLYEWLLINYSKEGDKILDTHLGSGSSRIAAYNLGFDFTGYELDKDYFEAQEIRFKNHTAQTNLFKPELPKKVEQIDLFKK